VARVLVVGCGCRGRELAAALIAAGHAVRGTTRHASTVGAIEATGAEAAVADPDRLATVIPTLQGVSALCWLMGTAAGKPEAIAAIHGPRLESLLETLVDTPVRGVVYEAAGTVEPSSLEEGARIAQQAADLYRMPVEVLRRDPSRPEEWLNEAGAAVDRVLSA
jgi:3-hydroxyisobutyrate dehydrogenase-like beta-hydroxyacid dehydrogenase